MKIIKISIIFILIFAFSVSAFITLKNKNIIVGDLNVTGLYYGNVSQTIGYLWDNIINIPSELSDGDNDTTYTNGTGVLLEENTFNISLDFTDSRYYTQTTADSTFFPFTGGTISGNVIISENLTVLGDRIEANVTEQVINGSNRPYITNLFSSGDEDHNWSNVYAYSLNGSLHCRYIYGNTGDDLCTIVNTDTNCSISGSCLTIAYMNYTNQGDFNLSGYIWIAGNIMPVTTLSYDLGSPIYRWNNSYIGYISADNINVFGEINATAMNVTTTYIDELFVTIINASYIYNPINSGFMDFTSDPWYIKNVDLRLLESLDVDGNINVDGNITTDLLCNSSNVCFTLTELNATNTATGDNVSWNRSYADELYPSQIHLTNNITDHNTSINNYINVQDANIRATIVANVSDNNDSIKDYVDGLNGTWQDINTNCSVTGSCSNITYLNTSNVGNLELSGNITLSGSDNQYGINLKGTEYLPIKSDQVGDGVDLRLYASDSIYADLWINTWFNNFWILSQTEIILTPNNDADDYLLLDSTDNYFQLQASGGQLRLDSTSDSINMSNDKVFINNILNITSNISISDSLLVNQICNETNVCFTLTELNATNTATGDNVSWNRSYADELYPSQNHLTNNITDQNTSIKNYIDAQDTIIRTDITNNISDNNISIKNYVDAQDTNIRTTITNNISDNNASILSFLALNYALLSHLTNNITDNNASIKSYIDDNFVTQTNLINNLSQLNNTLNFTINTNESTRVENMLFNCSTGQFQNGTYGNGTPICGIPSSSGSGGNISIFFNRTTSTLNAAFSVNGLTGYNAGNYYCNINFTGTHLCTQEEIMATYYVKNVSEIDDWTGTAWVAVGASKYTGIGVYFVNDCNGFTDATGADSYGNAWDFNNNKGLTGNCASLIPIACCKGW